MVKGVLVRFLCSLIGLYKRIISPLLPAACRFYPTCSSYADEALKQHGLIRGLAYTCWRLLRCNPLCEGGVDPVPSTERGAQ